MLKPVRYLVKTAGAAGILIVSLTAFQILFSDTEMLLVGFPAGLSRSLLIVIGLVFCLAWLLLCPGYKRFPFWVNLLLGTGVIGLSLYPGPVPLVKNDGLTLAAGLFFLLLSRFAAGKVRLNTRRFIITLPLMNLILFIAANQVIPPSDTITYNGELDYFVSLLNPAYRKIEGFEEEVEEYLKELSEDESLSEEDQQKLINELNQRISLMEQEINRFETLKERNRQYEDEIARLNSRIGEIEYDRGAGEEVSKVTSYAQAVRSSSPRVRDFAVNLAAFFPGTYYRFSSANPMPTREGMKQILTIHQYISGKWRYVNDPLFKSTDYYSPADRTIALGLAGDCDDFAILLASCIEAIGGKTRILHGTCGTGAHAWCEAYIGDADVWGEAMAEVNRFYPGLSVSYLTPLSGSDYWLCLDWQVGTYSCGNNPVYLYESSR